MKISALMCSRLAVMLSGTSQAADRGCVMISKSFADGDGRLVSEYPQPMDNAAIESRVQSKWDALRYRVLSRMVWAFYLSCRAPVVGSSIRVRVQVNQLSNKIASQIRHVGYVVHLPYLKSTHGRISHGIPVDLRYFDFSCQDANSSKVPRTFALTFVSKITNRSTRALSIFGGV